MTIAKSAYYSRQLYIYNLTFVQGSSKDRQTKDNTFMYTWTEDEFHKGSNEISSAVFHRLSKTDLTGKSKLVLVCDGCGGQNKNCIIIGTCARWMLTAPDTLESVTLLFPVTGHSFLPSDRVFGRIEGDLKKIETIPNPQKYKEVFDRYGTVIELGADGVEVEDWKKEAYAVLKKTTDWHFQFSTSKRFILTRGNDQVRQNVLVRGEQHYRTDIVQARNVCKAKQSVQMIDPDVIEKGVHIKPLKLRDVHKLLTKHYGPEWRGIEELSYFVGLLQSYDVNMVSDENENDEDEEEIEEDIVFEEVNINDEELIV